MSNDADAFCARYDSYVRAYNDAHAQRKAWMMESVTQPSIALAMRRGSEHYLSGIGDYVTHEGDGEIRLDGITMAFVGQGHALPEFPLNEEEKHRIATTVYEDFGWIVNGLKECAICGQEQEDGLHYLAHLNDHHKVSIDYQIGEFQLLEAAVQRAN